MTRYIVTTKGKLIDLEDKKISSWSYTCESADSFYEVYYFDQEEGQYLETDCQGGNSMDSIYACEIYKTGMELLNLCDGYYIDVKGRPFNCLWVYNDLTSCKKAAALLQEHTIRGFVKLSDSLKFICTIEE